MQIKSLSGHLTATEKTHLKALFSKKMLEGKVNKKTYFIDEISENKYKVKIKQVEKNDFGVKFYSSYTSTFSIKN